MDIRRQGRCWRPSGGAVPPDTWRSNIGTSAAACSRGGNRCRPEESDLGLPRAGRVEGHGRADAQPGRADRQPAAPNALTSRRFFDMSWKHVRLHNMRCNWQSWLTTINLAGAEPGCRSSQGCHQRAMRSAGRAIRPSACPTTRSPLAHPHGPACRCLGCIGGPAAAGRPGARGASGGRLRTVAMAAIAAVFEGWLRSSASISAHGQTRFETGGSWPTTPDAQVVAFIPIRVGRLRSSD
jgi:hypothetical protein